MRTRRAGVPHVVLLAAMVLGVCAAAPVRAPDARAECRDAGGLAPAWTSVAGACPPGQRAAERTVRRASAAAGQLRRGAVRKLAAGRLLVAKRELRDPNFVETVVVLTEFSKEGAVGLIVNRPTIVRVSRLLPWLPPSRLGTTIAYFGGPVSTDGVLALVRSPALRSDLWRVIGDVYLVRTREALEESVASWADASRIRIYAGYSGWGAGQLNDETAGGAWHVLDGDADVVFDREPESVWKRLIEQAESWSVEAAPGPRPPGPAEAAAYLPAAIGTRTSVRIQRSTMSAPPAVFSKSNVS